MQKYLQGNVTLSYRSLGIFVILFVVLVLTYFFALAEQKKALQAKIYVPPVVVSTPAPTGVPTPTVSPNTTIIPASNGEQGQTSFTATQHPDSHYFKAYSINYPSSWKLEHLKDSYGTSLSISKDGYELGIRQYGVDGVYCIFEGELPKKTYIADLRNTKYVEITTSIGTFRRYETTGNAGSPNKLMIGFCQEVEGEYRHTQLGSILYFVPKNYDESKLLEMDKILDTIQIVN